MLKNVRIKKPNRWIQICTATEHKDMPFDLHLIIIVHYYCKKKNMKWRLILSYYQWKIIINYNKSGRCPSFSNSTRIMISCQKHRYTEWRIPAAPDVVTTFPSQCSQSAQVFYLSTFELWFETIFHKLT